MNEHVNGWVAADLKIIEKIQTEFSNEQIIKLKQFHIYTLGDLIALWEIKNLKKKLSKILDADVDELDQLIAASRKQSFPLEKESLLVPVDNLQYQKYIKLCSGLKAPTEKRTKPPEQMQEAGADKKYLKTSQSHHIKQKDNKIQNIPDLEKSDTVRK